MPAMGIVPIYDPENRKTTWVNTSAKSFRTFVEQEINEKKDALITLCKQWQASHIYIQAGEEFVPALVKLFSIRS
jgi:hypothetical protein